MICHGLASMEDNLKEVGFVTQFMLQENYVLYYQCLDRRPMLFGAPAQQLTSYESKRL